MIPNNLGYRDWKGWDSQAFGAVDSPTSAYFAEELRQSGFESVRGLDVCEIGFGNGVFAGWARQRGANYRGTEAIPELIADGMSAGFAVFDATAPLASVVGDDSLDLLIAFDVFEHLAPPDLKRLLESLQPVLRHGGRVVARVPSGDSPFARAIQHGDLTHRQSLGSSAIRQFARETGFEVVSVREPAFPLRGLGFRTFLRRLTVVAARRLSFPIITHAFMNGGRPVLTPNLVFVLVKP